MTDSIVSRCFAPALAALAMLGPILLLVLASSLPIGQRGQFVVDGHIFLVALLATALTLRAVYEIGFERARKLFAVSANEPVTA